MQKLGIKIKLIVVNVVSNEAILASKTPAELTKLYFIVTRCPIFVYGTYLIKKNIRYQLFYCDCFEVQSDIKKQASIV